MIKRKIIIEVGKGDEIIQRPAKKFGGNASHVILPSSYIGKDLMIVSSHNVKVDIEYKTQGESDGVKNPRKVSRRGK